MYIGENIKYLRSQRGYSQEELAKALGYKSYTTITKWESGVSEPTLKMTNEIAKFFNISVNELCYTRLNAPKKNNDVRKGVAINVYGRVAAGIPLEMIEDIIDGDVVIGRKQEDAETNDVVIATVNGTDATCKRLKKYNDGIALISLNPKYEPMYFSKNEIEAKPVCIIGRVVELRAKF